MVALHGGHAMAAIATIIWRPGQDMEGPVFDQTVAGCQEGKVGGA